MTKYTSILTTICDASRMVASCDKSMFLYYGLNEHLLAQIQQLLHIPMGILDNGMKYMGHTLKLKCY